MDFLQAHSQKNPGTVRLRAGGKVTAWVAGVVLYTFQNTVATGTSFPPPGDPLDLQFFWKRVLATQSALLPALRKLWDANNTHFLTWRCLLSAALAQTLPRHPRLPLQQWRHLLFFPKCSYRPYFGRRSSSPQPPRASVAPQDSGLLLAAHRPAPPCPSLLSAEIAARPPERVSHPVSTALPGRAARPTAPAPPRGQAGPGPPAVHFQRQQRRGRRPPAKPLPCAWKRGSFFFFLIHRTFFWQVSTAPHKRHCPTRKENGTKAPHAPQLCRRSRPSAAQHGPAWPGPALRGPARRGTRAAAVPPSGPCRPRSPSAGHRARPARPGASGSPDAGRLRLLCGAAVGCRLAKGGGTRRALGLAGGTSIPPNRLRSPPSGCTRACVSAAGGAGATRPRLVAAPLRGGACLLGWVLLSRPGCLLLLPGFHRCKFIIFPLTYTPLSVGAVVKFRQFSLPLLHR